MSRRRRSDTAARCGASDAEYSSRRRLIVQAATTATRAEPPSASASAAASCDAPANTIVDRPIDVPPPRPVDTGVAPATSPKGMTPTSIGATAFAPASSSARAVVGIAASCRAVRHPPPEFPPWASYAVPHAPDGPGDRRSSP